VTGPYAWFVNPAAELRSLVASHPGVCELARALGAGRRVVASGVGIAAAGLTAAAVADAASRHVVLVVAHADDADEAADELASLPVIVLPALEVLPGETNVSLDLFAERLAAIRSVVCLTEPTVIVCPIQALMQLVPGPDQIASLARTVRAGEDVRLTDLTRWLLEAGYKRIETIEEPGDFSLRGGILDIFPIGAGASPVRLDYFGDTVERITEVDIESMGSDRAVKSVDLFAADAGRATQGDGGVSFLENVPAEALVLIAETMEVVEQGRGYFERVHDGKGIVGPPSVLRLIESRFRGVAELNQFSAGATGADIRIDLGMGVLPAFSKDLAEAVAELHAIGAPPAGSRVVVCCTNEGERHRLAELLGVSALRGGLEAASDGATDSSAVIEARTVYLHRGFVWRTPSSLNAEATTAFVPYHELVNRFTVRRRAGRLRAGRAMDTFLDFAPGDFVVHRDHGIARFEGLKVMTPREVPAAGRSPLDKKAVEPEEYLTLEFAGKSKLHVPAVHIDRVQKYIGGFAGKPPLSVLGGQKWQNQKERAAESVRDLAAELLRVRAAREHMPGIAYPADTPWQAEFEEEFPYEETPDQLAALSEIKKDMLRGRPMDRLICGDVGFGKTELAIRAAFKACEFGKQVAVLVPTTVLAEQHERTFRSRFAGYPFRIESVSRFKSDGEARAILDELRKGRVDLIIGTHRLLSKDVVFADLGLVIVDEEQRFGVEHKESLLRLRLTVDVLTLSATPIPRTLHMAMLGIRDISSLTTAPADRRAIVTEVFPYNEVRVKRAVERELAREGQVYFVHNRVHDIQSVADNVRRLCPEGTRIVVGHGQMPPHQLEEVMLKFIRRQADVLVATTIIESGIDIPTANTMLINDADRFGLADLHQLRGRVGRSKHRAYCYLLLPPDRTVKEVAQKRLKALEQFSMLGAGFKIAMRDLEIRGAGNILGAEQSGHIAAVGYEMYCHLLEEAVVELRNEKVAEKPGATSVEIGAGGLIPRTYIPSEARRLEAYRRLAMAATPEQLALLRKDLKDAYGAPPTAAERLFELAEIRIALAALGVRTCTIRERDVIFLCKDGGPVTAALQRSAAAGAASGATVRSLPPKEAGGLCEVYFRPPDGYLEPATLLAVLRRRLGITPPETGAAASTANDRPALRPSARRSSRAS